MSPRIVGAGILLTGIVLAGLGVYGTLRGPSLAALSDALTQADTASEFDCCSWLHHWWAWGIGMICAGGAIAIGGVALMRHRRWGFLLLAGALSAAAIAPWMIQALGLASFAYERANATETCIYLALSSVAVWGWFNTRRGQADA